MLSVVIATHDSERALLPTLAALVAGAAAGIVREVIVADAGSRDATAAIADGAGCRVLVSAQPRGARLKAAAEAARAPWLLFLRPGVVPDATWVDRNQALRRGGRTARMRRQLCRRVPRGSAVPPDAARGLGAASAPRSAQDRMQARDW